jgi:hypothetical protein
MEKKYFLHTLYKLLEKQQSQNAKQERNTFFIHSSIELAGQALLYLMEEI